MYEMATRSSRRIAAAQASVQIQQWINESDDQEEEMSLMMNLVWNVGIYMHMYVWIELCIHVAYIYMYVCIMLI